MWDTAIPKPSPKQEEAGGGHGAEEGGEHGLSGASNASHPGIDEGHGGVSKEQKRYGAAEGKADDTGKEHGGLGKHRHGPKGHKHHGAVSREETPQGRAFAFAHLSPCPRRGPTSEGEPQRATDGHGREGEPKAAPQPKEHATPRAGQTAGDGEGDVEGKQPEKDGRAEATCLSLGFHRTQKPRVDGLAEGKEGQKDCEADPEEEPNRLWDAGKKGTHDQGAPRAASISARSAGERSFTGERGTTPFFINSMLVRRRI